MNAPAATDISRDEPLIVSSLEEPAQDLRERFRQWGYLFFERGVPAADCQALMNEFLPALAPHVTPDGAGEPRLVGEPMTEADSVWDQVYPVMQSSERFHSFFHTEPALRLMRLVCGDDPFVYPMKMARVATPRRLGYETPPHQDAHSHQAPRDMAGIWIALHDVSEGMGRLKLLPRSHTRGVRPVFQAQGVGGVQCEIYADETMWHVGNVPAGGVILFDCCTVHKAEPNTSEDRVRMSVDTRFCVRGSPVFSTNLEPHHGWRIDGHDWESVYANWRSDELKYYWRDYPNLF